MLPLFSYGTLRDPEYQRELFTRTYSMQRARVAGFAALSSGGYLTAVPRPGASIDGALVYLDEAGYLIADAWEDLTVYERIEIEARLDDDCMQRCNIYVCPAARGLQVADGRLADRSRAEVLADIRRFRTSVAFMDRP